MRINKRPPAVFLSTLPYLVRPIHTAEYSYRNRQAIVINLKRPPSEWDSQEEIIGIEQFWPFRVCVDGIDFPIRSGF